MTKEQKLNLLKNRYNKLENDPKNIKAPGVKRKLARQIRSLSK